jgi:hypothetical protein
MSRGFGCLLQKAWAANSKRASWHSMGCTQ